MKRSILMVLFVMIANYTCLAQVDVNKYFIDDNSTVDVDRFHFGTDIYLPDSYNGSPYENEEFRPGIIFENNLAAESSLFLRYNAYEDIIEIKKNQSDDDDEIKYLKKTHDFYVKISNEILIYNESSEKYYKVLMLGNRYNLYKELNKKYYPSNNPINSFEKKFTAYFKDHIVYYLVTEDNEFIEIPSSKNKRLKFFGNKSNEIKDYFKKNNLDISEEKNLIRAVRYFDSFSDSSL